MGVIHLDFDGNSIPVQHGGRNRRGLRKAIVMRVFKMLALALCAATLVDLTSAEAAMRSRSRYRVPARETFVVPVAPRSFLDPGPVVPVGSLSRYVYAGQYPLSHPYPHINHFGEPPLPSYYEYPGQPLIDHIDFGPLSGSR